MMSTIVSSSRPSTLADLLDELGGLSPRRILRQPAPGTATENHLLELLKVKTCLCELVENVLVAKAVGYRESLVAMALAKFMMLFVDDNNLGLVSGEAGFVRLGPGLIRAPDVAFVSWDRIPGGTAPPDAIPDLAPDLAVEVLSESNTPGEMTRKRGEYFAAGVRLVWQIDIVARTVEVFTSETSFVVLTESDTLDGGEVLPGFSLPLNRLFEILDQQP